ncbi:glucose-1-phosphate cytidylyltransferase [Agrobacterium rosae]|uniref:glucose-1-phosphate cytidylyltransferase n=1 Tax=Agrobacterium rosae TaxID=1972867 RepID=UPI003BA2DBDF
MKAVILAGGLGTRLAEETSLKPKPMVEIGGRPMLWHIMKIYSRFGINDFIVCLGYKGYVVKEYFMNYHLHMADVTVDVADQTATFHRTRAEPWKVTLVDTGDLSMTGGRLKRVRDYVGDDDFCLTYGDGVSDLDIGAEIAFHKAHGRHATVTLVRPPGRFGAAHLEGDVVQSFQEKPDGDAGWINAGFFVLSPKVFDLIEGDETIWEKGPMEKLAASGQLAGFRHKGFWQPMDTLREKQQLEEMWQSGRAPWRVWS